MIRNTVAADKETLLEIVRDSGQFDAAALAHVEATLDAHLRGPSDAIWLTARNTESVDPVGVVFCQPEPVTAGTWNLRMLWTRQARAVRGTGSALVLELERRLHRLGARLLLVETSSLPAFDIAGVFYERCGFVREATIRHFYAQDDHKIVYAKQLP